MQSREPYAPWITDPDPLEEPMSPEQLQKLAEGAARGSALPPKADMCIALPNVCFGPKADMPLLFDHLVGGKQKFRRNGQAECLGRLEVDDEVVFGWLLIR